MSSASDVIQVAYVSFFGFITVILIAVAFMAAIFLVGSFAATFFVGFITAIFFVGIIAVAFIAIIFFVCFITAIFLELDALVFIDLDENALVFELDDLSSSTTTNESIGIAGY